ncbi:MAG: hypothetical protein ACR2M4_02660 [Actinomycetota bacterium]
MKLASKMFALLVVLGSFAALFAGPALAATGGGTAVGFSSTDADFPNNPNNNMPPPFCARSKDTQIDLTLAGTFASGTAAYAGTATVSANTDGTHFFGPEGTYSSSSCDPADLGPLDPISVSVSAVSGSSVAATTISCGAAKGEYWRLSTHVHLEWTTTCSVNGGIATATTLTVDVEQEPLSLSGAVDDPLEGVFKAA